jgi:exosortase/archaeosortase family protein
MVRKLLQPSPIRTFALKALGIFVLWYVLYELWLLPDGRIDYWVALIVIDGAAFLTELMGLEVWMQGRVVTIAGNNGIEMVDGCTGISAIGLFLGFIWAYPGQNHSRLYFSLLGIAIIYLVNVIRIAILMLMQKWAPQFFDFTHDYSTTTIFYLVIFFLWMLWVRIADCFEALKTQSPPKSIRHHD